MFIEVNKIAPDGLEVVQSLALPPLQQEGGDPIPVVRASLVGHVKRAGADFVFRGRMETVVSVTCSRCLAMVPLRLEGPYYRIYRAGTLHPSRGEESPDTDDLALTPFDGVRIDLDELAREQIYLLLPLKPLCAGSCKGICPRCGANRNLIDCDCRPDPGGPEPLTLKMPL